MFLLLSMFCHPRDRVTRLAVKRLSLRAVDLQKFHRVGLLLFTKLRDNREL